MSSRCQAHPGVLVVALHKATLLDFLPSCPRSAGDLVPLGPFTLYTGQVLQPWQPGCLCGAAARCTWAHKASSMHPVVRAVVGLVRTSTVKACASSCVRTLQREPHKHFHDQVTVQQDQQHSTCAAARQRLCLCCRCGLTLQLCAVAGLPCSFGRVAGHAILQVACRHAAVSTAANLCEAGIAKSCKDVPCGSCREPGTAGLLLCQAQYSGLESISGALAGKACSPSLVAV